MVKRLSTAELVLEASRGVSLTISAAQLSVDDIKAVASKLCGNGVLTVIQNGTLSTNEMAAIATTASVPGHVIFR